jgi:hypothetical protein
MARHIFIVGRAHRDLYEVLVRRFANDRNVSVVFDRRVGDRRVHVLTVSPDRERRRSPDRRRRQSIDEELRSRSHAIVTLEDPRGDAGQ